MHSLARRALNLSAIPRDLHSVTFRDTASEHPERVDLAPEVPEAVWRSVEALFAAPSDPDVIAVILNKIGAPEKSGMTLDHHRPAKEEVIDYRSACNVFRSGRFHLLAEIPWQPHLLAPRVSDVARELGVPVLHEGHMHSVEIMG